MQRLVRKVIVDDRARSPRERRSSRLWRTAVERGADALYDEFAPTWGHDADAPRPRRAAGK
jgi:hypothetical protein